MIITDDIWGGFGRAGGGISVSSVAGKRLVQFSLTVCMRLNIGLIRVYVSSWNHRHGGTKIGRN